MCKGFHKEEGPFVNALDVALASFNIYRQAYYSGTFIGNHVHRTLKVDICNLFRSQMIEPACIFDSSALQHRYTM